VLAYGLRIGGIARIGGNLSSEVDSDNLVPQGQSCGPFLLRIQGKEGEIEEDLAFRQQVYALDNPGGMPMARFPAMVTLEYPL
jgi:hypothetical protein